MRCSFNS